MLSTTSFLADFVLSCLGIRTAKGATDGEAKWSQEEAAQPSCSTCYEAALQALAATMEFYVCKKDPSRNRDLVTLVSVANVYSTLQSNANLA
jgi:hypothetical protein